MADISGPCLFWMKNAISVKVRCSKCEGYEHYVYQCPSESQHVKTVSSDDVDSKVAKDVHIPSKTVNIIENIAVGSNISIIDEGHASYEGTSEIVGAIVESGTPLDVVAHAHDISEYVPELEESSVSSQISRYSFTTPLIEYDIKLEIIDSSVVTSNGSSESPRAEYDFVVVPIDSSSSESHEFLAMIQQMVSVLRLFLIVWSLCLLSKSNILPSVGLDVCHHRHPRYIFFPSLEIMPRVPLHCICLLHILMISLGR